LNFVLAVKTLNKYYGILSFYWLRDRERTGLIKGINGQKGLSPLLFCRGVGFGWLYKRIDITSHNLI